MSITAVQPSAQNIISVPTETLWGVWRTDKGTHSQEHVVEAQAVSLIAKLSPFHGYLPLAHLLSVHIIEVACVVVWVRAAEDQFSTWKVFWVSENNKFSMN